MKRICLLLTNLFLFCGWAGAQNDIFSFNETDHNFGVIGEDDGSASFDFVMTNNSIEPVVITRVTTSCGCTTPTWTREPIERGKTGTISIGYNPQGRIGSFNKSISVYVNQTAAPLYLRIKGEVVRGTKRFIPEVTYPVAIGNYLLKTKELEFGKAAGKETNTIRWEVYNNSDQPITQKVVKLPKYMTVFFNPVIIPAKTQGIVDVNLNVQDYNLYGNLSGEITLAFNNAQQSFPFSATVLENFSGWTTEKKAHAGKLNVSMNEINFGNFTAGNERTLKISNSGKSVLNIHNIQSSDPAVTVSKTRFSVNPGELGEFKIIADSRKIQSKQLSSTLMIVTDDPNTPIYKVSIFANK